MKNIFFVVNKEKIYAYVVSIMTIVTIFFMTGMINSDMKDTEEVSSNSIQENMVIENTNTVKQTSTDIEKESAIGEAVSTSTSYINDVENTQILGNTTQ